MFSPSNNMRPKVFTSWWHKGSTSRVFPSLASTTACEKNNITNQNAEDQQNNNNATNKDPTLSILLREARDALIQTGERNSNLDLCARLDCAISAAEEDELNEKLVQSKTAEHQKRSSNFISSLTNFDDELTNFFLYNYSDHHGDHESLHNILKSVHCLIQKNNNNKNNSNDQISISPRSMNRHKSVATTHSLTHTVTSAKILELLVTWNFNIFELYDLVGPNTFVIVGDGIIQHLNNLITTLGFEQDKFLATLKCLGESYLDNPYHNQLHGADVAQALNWTLMFGGAANVFTPLDSGLDTQQQILSENDSDDMNRVPKITMLASVLAALAHDVGHPGVNNNYLIEVSDPLALTYNDHSPLEHMHAATFFRILQKDECTFIPTEFKEKRRAMRGVIVNMILSTDMMKHGSLVNLLKTRLTNGGATLTDDGRDIQMVLNICLHLADISNPARDISIAVPWAKRIQEEFWNQGDLLRVYNESAVIAPMNDRDYASITPTHESSLQIGFTLGLVKPLFELVHSIDGVNLNEPLKCIKDNITTYTTLKDETLSMTIENVKRVLEYQIK